MLRRIHLTARGNASLGSSFNSPGRACQRDPNVLKELDSFLARYPLRSSPALGKLGVQNMVAGTKSCIKSSGFAGAKMRRFAGNNALLDESSVE
jgi:hypothetical protein